MLLARYHFDDELDLVSSGLCNIYIKEKTLEVGGYWEKAIKILKEKFGYEFERSYGIDKNGNETIFLKPLKKGSTFSHNTNQNVLTRLRAEYVLIGKYLDALEKDTEYDYMTNTIFDSTETFRNLVWLLRNSENI